MPVLSATRETCCPHERLRARVVALEADYPDGSLPQPLKQHFRINGQVVPPLIRMPWRFTTASCRINLLH
jgi:hypothetical protein